MFNCIIVWNLERFTHNCYYSAIKKRPQKERFTLNLCEESIAQGAAR